MLWIYRQWIWYGGIKMSLISKVIKESFMLINFIIGMILVILFCDTIIIATSVISTVIITCAVCYYISTNILITTLIEHLYL